MQNSTLAESEQIRRFNLLDTYLNRQRLNPTAGRREVEDNGSHACWENPVTEVGKGQIENHSNEEVGR